MLAMEVIIKDIQTFLGTKEFVSNDRKKKKKRLHTLFIKHSIRAKGQTN